MKWISLLLLTTSCSMIPTYQQPKVPLAKEWSIPKTDNSVNTEWWSQFGDKVLNKYILSALKNNQDLKVAIARVDAFFARVGIIRSELYPQVELPVEAIREKQSGNVINFGPLPNNLFNIYSFGLQGSLQLDLWGKIRSATKEAQALLCNQIEVRRTIVLNLVTSVASTYVTVLALDKQLKIAQETIKIRDEAYFLAKTRFDLGLTSFMQVDQARSELEIAMVSADNLAIQIAFGENQLNFLLGRSKGKIKRGKLIDDYHPPLSIPSDLPANLLTQRPDILAAEQLLIAANANIGVARAEFLPNFSLTGAAGFASSQLSNLVNSPSSTWQYGVDILQAVFTGGRLTSNLELAKALKQQQLHNYVSTIFKACSEVNNALIDHKITLSILETLKDRVKTVNDYFHLATLRYNEGETDYLNFLDAERQLFNTELEYALTQGKAYTTLISVYAALGGGWVLKADDQSEVFNQKGPNCN